MSRSGLVRTVVLLATAATVAATIQGSAGAAGPPPVPPSVQPIIDGDLTAYQWMLEAVNAPEAWSVSTGAGTTVAVIDTGVDATHPDLQGQVVPGGVVSLADDGTVSIVDATVEKTSNDWYGHGSHVSGIVAGDADGNGITGIAPDAKVMPVQLLTRRSQMMSAIQFLDAVTGAISFAVDHGADAMNLSLGTLASHIADTPRTAEYRAALARTCDAVADATDAGVVVVAAAGNGGFDFNLASAPASCPGAVSVAAVTPDFGQAFFSSFDPTVALSAPGFQVLSVDSTVADMSRAAHIEESGTSMASPVVAGVAALVKSAHPGYDASDVLAAMTSTAQDLGAPGRDADTGFGLVDAAAALGVATPDAKPQDYLSSYAVEALTQLRTAGAATARAGVVSWSTPDAHAVTGYTVSIYDSQGTTTHEVGPLEVRLQLPMAKDAWAQVTAHTTAGDVASFPTALSSVGSEPEPEVPPAVRAVRAERHGDSVTVRWDPPAKRRDVVDQIRVGVIFDNGQWVTQKVRVSDGAPFPTHARVKLPAYGRWHDAKVGVATVARTPGWGAFMRIAWGKQPLPAVFGMHVHQVLAAGARAVEISGGISPIWSRQTCGPQRCAGRQVTVRIDYGRSVGEVTTRLTSRGTFHAVAWRPAGSDRVRLRILGPDDLSSGPFRSYPVGR